MSRLLPFSSLYLIQKIGKIIFNGIYFGSHNLYYSIRKQTLQIKKFRWSENERRKLDEKYKNELGMDKYKNEDKVIQVEQVAMRCRDKTISTC